MFGFHPPSVPEITPDALKAVLDGQQDCVLLDVRTEAEFNRGKLINSINLPVDQVAARIEQLIPDKTATIYVYCLSGSRSVVAVDTMIRMGYQHVYNLTQGLLAWRVKQYPVESSKQ